MALEDYKKKRNFSVSPEPSGAPPHSQGAAGVPLFFCVQKHLASHLHYDLRLEWNGVLLSWAVPKGPSLEPSDKRLAMHVEDHPVEYGTFEGVIPAGYGAGIVMLWDRGTWEPEVEDVAAALQKGDLKFRLHGFKLKGSWVLVRTRGYSQRGPRTASSRPEPKDEGRSWLLIKHRDEWAGAVDIATFAPLSVKTPDADLADILAAENPDVWKSNRPAQGGDTGRLFDTIIRRALEIKQSAVTENTKIAKATKTQELEENAPAPRTAQKVKADKTKKAADRDSQAADTKASVSSKAKSTAKASRKSQSRRS